MKLQHLRGTSRVSSFRSAGTHVLPHVIERLRERHPGLKVEVQEVDSRVADPSPALMAGTADVALTMSILAHDLIYWELFRDRYVAVVPSSLRQPDGARSSSSDLSRARSSLTTALVHIPCVNRSFPPTPRSSPVSK
jgi:DNA-binding transcriptional LysR family regulator